MRINDDDDIVVTENIMSPPVSLAVAVATMRTTNQKFVKVRNSAAISETSRSVDHSIHLFVRYI